jgi:hypothetical protein
MLLSTFLAFGGCSDAAGPSDSDLDGITDDVDQCPTKSEVLNNWSDTDGCPDSAAELYGVARKSVEDFRTAELRRANHTLSSHPRPLLLFRPRQLSCGPGSLNNAFYCPAFEAV